MSVLRRTSSISFLRYGRAPNHIAAVRNGGLIRYFADLADETSFIALQHEMDLARNQQQEELDRLRSPRNRFTTGNQDRIRRTAFPIHRRQAKRLPDHLLQITIGGLQHAQRDIRAVTPTNKRTQSHKQLHTQMVTHVHSYRITKTDTNTYAHT